jgi:hypothetical protein
MGDSQRMLFEKRAGMKNLLSIEFVLCYWQCQDVPKKKARKGLGFDFDRRSEHVSKVKIGFAVRTKTIKSSKLDAKTELLDWIRI